MKRLLLCVGLLLAGLIGKAQAVEPPLDPALDSELSHLITLAYDRPEASLQAVRAMRNTQSSPGALLQLRLAEAQILIQWGRTEQAEALIGALEREASAHDRSLLLRAQISERQGRFGEAGEFAREGLRRLEAQCPASELARAIQQGRCDFRAAWWALRILERGESAQGGLAQAGATIQRALALAQAGQDRYLASVSMNTLALLSQELDQPDEARRWLALGLEQAQGDPMALSLNKVAEARVAVRRGDKRGQLNAYEEALDHAQRAEAPHTVAQIRVNLVDLHMHNGRPAVAMEEARLALPVLQSFRDLRLERTLRHNMGVSLLLLKQFDAARRELARAQQLASEQPNPARRATELREIGQAWAASGQPREAITVFHAERALSAQIQARNRETQLQQLKLKYDSDRNQRDLDLLTRDRSLKDQQLANHELAQRVGMAVALLLGLSLVLVVVMLQRVRAANRQLKANQRLLRSQSERDPLTDLANRRHFLAVMQKQAQQLFTGGLLMIDIDHFKHVNDQQGHAVGDVVIRDVAQRIRDAVRTEDLVVRWGGEEFLVFAPNVSQDTLSLLAERVLNSVGGQPVATENGPLRVTVSIGFAHFPLPPGLLRQHWEQAVNWADMVLYTAKAQGRNRAVGIATVDAQDAAALLEIEADFDAACHSQRVRLLHIPGP
ncbi:UNVERIFIED_ORG: diguanylate cyclase [Shinella sp. XGS7]|nr:diguanylate cyclase [Shinella sp. XGS7]